MKVRLNFDEGWADRKSVQAADLTGCQGWKKYTEDWVDTIPTYISRGRVKIGAHEQTGVLHYVNKDFIKTDVQGMFK